MKPKALFSKLCIKSSFSIFKLNLSLCIYISFLLLLSRCSRVRCLTLCNPIDGSPPGSPVPGILQARTPEWVAISFSNAWKWKVKGKSLSCVWPSATPWTAAYQAPPSMGFSRQEYWSGVPLPSPATVWLVAKNWTQLNTHAHIFAHHFMQLHTHLNTYIHMYTQTDQTICH